MLFTYVLASALAFSVVLGRTSGPRPIQVTYETEDEMQFQTKTDELIMGVDNRSSNLKYVMAIQSSSIWSEIKKRSLTINTQPLNKDAVEKSPKDMSDHELAQLKQVCHDGLKCVAVDQLLVLQEVSEPIDNGKVSVRMAITKITQVLTQYTTEYYEDVYEYEVVQPSDDQSKVYKSLTTIVEDNKELCRIDVTPVETVETRPKNGDRNCHPAVVGENRTVNIQSEKNFNINNGTYNESIININPASDKNAVSDQSETVTPINVIPVETVETPHKKDNTEGGKNNAVNYNLVENYNINNGTINDATINIHPSGGVGVTESPEPRSSSNHTNDQDLAVLVVPHTDETIDSPVKNESVTKAPQNHVRNKRANDGAVSGNGSVDKGTDNSSGQKVHQVRPDVTISKTESGNNTNRHDSAHPHVDKTADRSAPTNDARKFDANSDPNVVHNNKTNVKNGGDGRVGTSDSDIDIMSSGSHNDDNVKKGYVTNGTLNNGKMVVYNNNTGTINSGKITGSNADGGIINVGTVNNGAVNYGDTNKYTNNGVKVRLNSDDIQQYLSSINQMYSTILERLA